MSFTIPRPKHLDLPDEVVHGNKLVHVYVAHPNGKRLIESLIWLAAHYTRVELQVPENPTCDSPVPQLVCSGAFMIPEDD